MSKTTGILTSTHLEALEAEIEDLDLQTDELNVSNPTELLMLEKNYLRICEIKQEIKNSLKAIQRAQFRIVN